MWPGHTTWLHADSTTGPEFLSAWRIADEPEAGTRAPAEIVGLYLSPPEGALVLSMDQSRPFRWSTALAPASPAVGPSPA